ncbi:hypothetical protein CRG98_024579 [Punica granatum]|uniref:Uncharacterized protein n=1 Tax=Punica granatum TaxID=22663 RepID=A0A2I0JGD4_PUNGR|nr:hypothetical protein CRG98_024579 [Punica granatum]
MARLAKVVGRNGTYGNSNVPEGLHWDPMVFAPRKFDGVWLKSGRAAIGISSGFPLVLASFDHEVGCAGMRREGLGVGAAGQEGWSRGLGGQAEVMGSSRGSGFEPWLGGLAWLNRGSHLTRRKA